ncbi:MAG: pyrimidine 5'-nucleotidase [Anaerolineae bacterium]|nr:pyrimidine 5'-nucleotidase [Anaerolineae bacterium]
MIRAILFDLDDTLYPRQAGIMEQIRILMLRYLRTRLDLSPEEADTLRRRYFQEFGTTMRGLQLNHHIDVDEFLDFVHDIPLRNHIQLNPELDAALASLSQQKVVFTNASREHAERVLDALGVAHHFDRIVDVRDVGFESKPQMAAYRRICELIEVPPEECLLVEDNVRNLRPGKSLGMTTVLVGEDHEGTDPDVDYVLDRVEGIGQVIREIEQAALAEARREVAPRSKP